MLSTYNSVMNSKVNEGYFGTFHNILNVLRAATYAVDLKLGDTKEGSKDKQRGLH